jgi:hypothetical protein
MVKTDLIGGLIDGVCSFHYDIGSDVLYFRLLSDMRTPAIGNETDDGMIELRQENTDRLIGLTVISWWKRFGTGPLPDSISEIQKHIEPLAKNVTA